MSYQAICISECVCNAAGQTLIKTTSSVSLFNSTKHVLIRKDLTTILCSVRCAFLVPRKESVHSSVPTRNEPWVCLMLDTEPGQTLTGMRHSRSSAMWPCQKQTLSAAAVAGCGDDGWPLQRWLIPSEAPSSLQDTMARVVAISVLGWSSVL